MPLTSAEIHVKNAVTLGNTTVMKNEVYYFVVSGDAAQETPIGSGRYDHTLALVEPTKVAECVVMDTITFTNDIGRNYTENAHIVTPVQTEG